MEICKIVWYNWTHLYWDDFGIFVILVAFALFFLCIGHWILFIATATIIGLTIYMISESWLNYLVYYEQRNKYK